MATKNVTTSPKHKTTQAAEKLARAPKGKDGPKGAGAGDTRGKGGKGKGK